MSGGVRLFMLCLSIFVSILQKQSVNHALYLQPKDVEAIWSPDRFANPLLRLIMGRVMTWLIELIESFERFSWVDGVDAEVFINTIELIHIIKFLWIIAIESIHFNILLDSSDLFRMGRSQFDNRLTTT